MLPLLAPGWLLGALVAAVSTGKEAPPGGADMVIQLISTPDPVPCPESARVAEAMTTRIPGVLAVGAIPPGTALLGLSLSRAGASAVRLQLHNSGGATVLERVLDATAPGVAGRPERVAATCAALADTVALIVERYLRQVGYRGAASLPPESSIPDTGSSALASPSPPASPPRGSVTPTPTPTPTSTLTLQAPPAPGRTARGFLGAGVVLSAPVGGAGGEGRWIGYLDLVAELHLGALALSASAGVGQATDKTPVPLTDGGSLHIVPTPIRVGVGFIVHVGSGHLVPGVGGGVELLWTSTRRIDGEHPRTVVEPLVEGGAAYFQPLGHRTYLKLHAASVVNLQPHDFALDGGAAPTIFRTARWTLRGGLDLGIALGQDRRPR